ncbi:MAG: hypothetical protein PHF65_03050 [Oscillospiraceae bacterium]|nr:hypothetical protein [Oscillospiraceae bacterium]
MDWIEAAGSIPPLEKKDLLRFNLTVEDEGNVLNQYNRSLRNITSDSADIAGIALRKLLTRFPDWGEASLLFGICLAIEGKMNRAAAVFEHALDVGLRSEQLTYLAQVSVREAREGHSKRTHPPEETNPAKNILNAVIPKQNPLVQEENQIRPRTHMQAPILMKASRRPTRAKMATDRERRELLMQSTSSNGEIPDDEINVSIPKTPAEKLRIALIVVAAILLLTGAYFLTTLLILPQIDKAKERDLANKKLEFLTGALFEKKSDPEIAEILARYESEYGSSQSETTNPDEQAEP